MQTNKVESLENEVNPPTGAVSKPFWPDTEPVSVSVGQNDVVNISIADVLHETLPRTCSTTVSDNSKIKQSISFEAKACDDDDDDDDDANDSVNVDDAVIFCVVPITKWSVTDRDPCNRCFRERETSRSRSRSRRPTLLAFTLAFTIQTSVGNDDKVASGCHPRARERGKRETRIVCLVFCGCSCDVGDFCLFFFFRLLLRGKSFEKFPCMHFGRPRN